MGKQQHQRMTGSNTAAWMFTSDGVPLYTTSFGAVDIAGSANVKSGVLNCGTWAAYHGQRQPRSIGQQHSHERLVLHKHQRRNGRRQLQRPTFGAGRTF